MTQIADQTAEYLTIGEAAELTSVTQRTLRYYEELGLVTPSGRVAGGQRAYGPQDIARIQHILRMKDLLGFSLSEIKTVVEAEEARQLLQEDYRQEQDPAQKLRKMQEAAEIARRQLALVDEKIVQMQAMRERLAEDVRCFEAKLGQLVGSEDIG